MNITCDCMVKTFLMNPFSGKKKKKSIFRAWKSCRFWYHLFELKQSCQYENTNPAQEQLRLKDIMSLIVLMLMIHSAPGTLSAQFVILFNWRVLCISFSDFSLLLYSVLVQSWVHSLHNCPHPVICQSHEETGPAWKKEWEAGWCKDTYVTLAKFFGNFQEHPEESLC